MPKDKTSRTRRKTVRTSIKRLSAVACAILAVVSALAYFRNDLLLLSLMSVSPDGMQHDMPSGSILIPYDNGLCRLHALDNATGRIHDDGLVDCLDASEQNSAAWKSLTDQQRANQIRRSFRHE
jgi:hypothetical protein